MDNAQMSKHLARRSRCRGHHIMIFAKPCRRPVIHDTAIFTQHQTIAHTTAFERAKSICVDKIQKLGSIFAFDIDLAKGRYIADPNRRAHRQNFPITGLAPRLIPLHWKIAWPVPSASIKGPPRSISDLMGGADPAQSARPRRFSLRSRIHGKCTTGDGRGDERLLCSRLRDRTTRYIGQNSQCSDIRVFSLIGRHSLRCVTLHMLNRAIIFIGRLADKCLSGRHVVCENQPFGIRGTAPSFLLPFGLRPKRCRFAWRCILLPQGVPAVACFFILLITSRAAI